jgi:hypothetical protein
MLSTTNTTLSSIMASISSSTPLNEGHNGVPLLLPAATRSSEESKQTTKKVVKRIPWKAIEVGTIGSDGIKKITHPFLEETNKLDLEIAKVMLVRYPYKRKHGMKDGAWKLASRELSLLEDRGSRIFTNGINVKQLKDRFKKLMEFFKSFQGQVNFKSGNDDEEAPRELLQALKDLYEEFDLFQQRSRARDRKKAETLRLVPMGEVTDESRELVREARESKSKTPKTAPNAKYASTPSSGESDPISRSDLIQSYNKRIMSERIELCENREERKRQKLDVERERIAHDYKSTANDYQRIANDYQRIAYDNERTAYEYQRIADDYRRMLEREQVRRGLEKLLEQMSKE